MSVAAGLRSQVQPPGEHSTARQGFPTPSVHHPKPRCRRPRRFHVIPKHNWCPTMLRLASELERARVGALLGREARFSSRASRPWAAWSAEMALSSLMQGKDSVSRGWALEALGLVTPERAAVRADLMPDMLSPRSFGFRRKLAT